MIDSELLKAFRELSGNKLKYCHICFRDERERVIKRPVSLIEVMKVVDFVSIKTIQLVCSICEARAASALKLLKEIDCAFSAHQLWRDLKSNVLDQSHLEKYVSGQLKNAKKAYKQAVEIERDFSIHRRNTQLCQTEVLLVDNSASLKNEIRIAKAKSKNASTVTIVIDDDEEQTKLATPKLVPIEKLLEKTHLPVPGASTATIDNPNAFELHPVVFQPNGAMVVPSLNCFIINDSNSALLSTFAPITPLLNQISVMPSPQINVGVTTPILPIPDSVNTNVLPMKPSRNPVKRKSFSPMEPLQKRDRGDDLNISELTVPLALDSDSVVVSDSESNSDRSSASTEDVVKAPVRSSVRIDWEDKIPMDLISIVDPKETIVQPATESSNLGTISDVRTVSEEVENIINLC